MSDKTKAGRFAVLAVDQGTSSTKAVVVGADGRVLGKSSIPVGRVDIRPGWVEQNAAEIRDSVLQAISIAIAGSDASVVTVGLSNQRESAVIWSRDSGGPLGPMLGWQDRRTAGRAAQYERRGLGEVVRAKTGLPLDPMFSALKFQWLLDQVDPDRDLARAGRIALGTVDSWILHCLTGEHRIEVGNASRTQLLNLESGQWDSELLDVFNIPMACLPEVLPSNRASDALAAVPGLANVRVASVLGDSHAALYAHGVRTPGRVKATYGTGGSVMGLIDGYRGTVSTAAGLVQTIAWHESTPTYAFEGTILSLGATLLWLSSLLGLEPTHLADLAKSGSGEVDLVPAFAGLGAPYWDERAVAIISGFGLGTRPADLAHAAFESIALQTEAVLGAAERDLGFAIDTMLVDGGPTQNDWLMQLQADLSQRSVLRSNVAELSAMGAAHMAGVSAGLWSETECLRLPRDRSLFTPNLTPQLANARSKRWQAAVARSRFAVDQEEDGA